MFTKITNFTIQPLMKLLYSLKSNPQLRRLIMDFRNSSYFSSLERHEHMLSDQVRINTYQAAISKLVKKDDVVVDLGTGTGVLSFFASRQQPKQIYALDHSNIIDVAKKIAQHNGIDSIEFVRTNSRDFTPSEKVDVLLHEQMGTHLFAENMIRNICDLRDRILAEDGRVIPGRFSLFIEPIRLKEEYKIPYVSEHNFHGVSYGCLQDNNRENNSDNRQIHPYQVEALLCDPEPILELDFKTLDPKTLPHKLSFKKKITNAGRMDGVCLYWIAHFDDELELSTSPLDADNHWGSCFLRSQTQDYDRGTTFEYDWKIDDMSEITTWNYQVKIMAPQKIVVGSLAT